MGAGVSALNEEAKANLAADIKATLESKSDLDDKQLYDEISAMIIERAESKGGPEIDQQNSVITAPPVIGGGVRTRRLSEALQVHLVEPDHHEQFKIGDVVRAAPGGSGMKFEGVAVNVDDDHIVVDFGDGEDPSVIERSKVQRIQNGSVLEKDDIVQCKPPGTPIFCQGRVLSVHEDGTYDIAYEGTDEVDEHVELKFLRKVGSGRSSVNKKLKKAVSAISAARAFGGGFGAFGTSKVPKVAEGKEAEAKE
ncbi:hypothetical protein TrVE_jg5254 [Triparma verrucosa]|uniref:Uncharacterized protein n=1 Tax=Triparma verrucosa TaxID=1606542 RepID=A0A9W7EP03_9STRA|nr:hypothetical protein TrVE_jg5254 [Triparma verrucosa]